MGNGETKELICMTHGHELRDLMLMRSGYRHRRIKGRKKGTTIIVLSIKYIFQKRVIDWKSTEYIFFSMLFSLNVFFFKYKLFVFSNPKPLEVRNSASLFPADIIFVKDRAGWWKAGPFWKPAHSPLKIKLFTLPETALLVFSAAM